MQFHVYWQECRQKPYNYNNISVRTYQWFDSWHGFQEKNVNARGQIIL